MDIENPEAESAQIAKCIASYIDVLTVQRDPSLAGEYYTDDARLLGPGMNLDRAGVVDVIRATLEAGVQVQVERRTLELFVHGGTAYEIAEAEDTFHNSDGTSNTLRNRMFIRWERGTDAKWRFARVMLSPILSRGNLR
ncbi:MAG TPA: nuclear transport factor 2 family protein [Vicinamibacterales bacterium]|nr:nuclear transport factor 2 family protein [Vicinamibacterales bacterium]